MRQYFRWSVAGVAALLMAVAGCTPGGSDSPKTTPDADKTAVATVNTDPASLGDVELVMWDQEVRPGQASQFTQLVADFQTKYPNIKVNRVEQSFEDLTTTLALALTDPNPPDIVQANNSRSDMGAFVTAGHLLSLEPYAEAYGWRDRFSENVLRVSSYSADGKEFGKGNLYGLPQMGEVVGVFYNKAKLKALGLSLPTTWSEFAADLGAAKIAGETPLMLGNVEGWPAGHVFGPIQGAHVPADQIVALGMGNPGASWTTPENIAAAQELSDWVKASYFNEGFAGGDYDTAVKEFTEGTGVFLMAGSWVGEDVDSAMGDNVGFFAPPPPTAGQPVATTGGTSLPFSITSASKNADAAAAFINYITSDDAMKVLADTGNLPILRTAELAPASGVWADVFAAFGSVSQTGTLLPYLDWATPSFGDEALKPGLQDLMAGKKTAEQFVEALQTDYAAFTAS